MRMIKACLSQCHCEQLTSCHCEKSIQCHCEPEGRSNLFKKIASLPTAPRNDTGLVACNDTKFVSRNDTRGFSLIEIIMTIVIMGIALVPLGGMSMEYVRSTVYSRDLGVAQGLVKVEMSKINNLPFNDDLLADGTDVVFAGYEGYVYDVRRIVNFVPGFSEKLKQVTVSAYPSGKPGGQLIKVITYIADVNFGVGSGDVPVGSFDANFLEVTGGSIYNAGSTHELRDVVLTNVGPGPITISKIEATFAGSSGVRVQQVRIIASDGDRIRLTGPLDSPFGPSNLAPNAVFNGEVSFNNPYLLNFNNKNVSAVTRLVFTMSDGSKSVEYSW